MCSGPQVVQRDLRLLAVASAAWLGTLLGLLALGAPGHGQAAVALLGAGVCAALAAAGVARRHGTGSGWVPLLVWLGTAAVLAGLAGVRVQALGDGTVRDLAEQRSRVTVSARVQSDPVSRPAGFGSGEDGLIYRVLITSLSRPVALRVRSPVLVMADAVPRPRWGGTVELEGRLGPTDDRELQALLVVDRTGVEGEPGLLLRAAERVRASIRRAAGGPAPGDLLVPALVDGDDAALPAQVVADFRTAGLTHLTAVSGANLTILLGVLLPLARWSGVRARGVHLVAVLGVVGFVLITRPEPSVLRAAVMGLVALVGMGAGGRGAGLRALGAAVLCLLLVSPTLATSWGFALSVCATGGILLLAPGLTATLSTHLPLPLAQAIAVPIAAQLACTPLVAALSDQVSLVAVAANLAAAPLVAPTTVLGLAGGALGLVWPPLGRAPGEAAGWCAYGIVVVARRSAAVPGAAVPWPGHGWPLVALCLACLVVLGLVRPLARRPGLVLLTAGVLLGALLVPGAVRDRLVPGTGWPPPAWAVVMCDVGQGDAVAVRTGEDSALVVDAGPDPASVARCLDRLRVERVPAVVLTHFHQDHVGGLSGVLEGRTVGEVQVSPLALPESGAASVERLARDAELPVRVPAPGEEASAGGAHWQVVGPVTPSGESPNDASLVLLVEVAGIRVLLAGDLEPLGQAALAARWDLGDVDVIKVPHHGSRYQDQAWLGSLDAEVALVSVGAENDYGHPAPDTVSLLEGSGAAVWRTDTDGDLALTSSTDGPVVTPR